LSVHLSVCTAAARPICDVVGSAARNDTHAAIAPAVAATAVAIAPAVAATAVAASGKVAGDVCALDASAPIIFAARNNTTHSATSTAVAAVAASGDTSAVDASAAHHDARAATEGAVTTVAASEDILGSALSGGTHAPAHTHTPHATARVLPSAAETDSAKQDETAVANGLPAASAHTLKHSHTQVSLSPASDAIARPQQQQNNQMKPEKRFRFKILRGDDGGVGIR